MILLSCLVLSWTSAGAASSSPASQTILVWGDSLSAGHGLFSVSAAWPALLQQRLQQGGFSHQVVNGSVSGETSAGGRSRLPAALETHQPVIVIIELGANDGLRGLKPALMAENLAAMVTAARTAGAQVLLVGMELPPNYGANYTQAFEQAFVDVALQQKIPLVPFLLAGFADRPALFQADGLHPTAEAQPLILDTVWKGLEPLLKK